MRNVCFWMPETTSPFFQYSLDTVSLWPVLYDTGILKRLGGSWDSGKPWNPIVHTWMEELKSLSFLEGQFFALKIAGFSREADFRVPSWTYEVLSAESDHWSVYSSSGFPESQFERSLPAGCQLLFLGPSGHLYNSRRIGWHPGELLLASPQCWAICKNNLMRRLLWISISL